MSTQESTAESKLDRTTSHTPSFVPVAPEKFAEEDGEAGQYPGPAKVAIIMFSLYISMFLVALDRTIIGTAIPKITNQFHSIEDIGWYGAAYMLTACGFILLYGRVYTFFDTKWTFLSGITLFEIGSAICGASPSSTALIIGRAIAGFGSAGIFTGAITIMLRTVPLHRRPAFQGLFGACFGVASVAGPLVGGAFTESKATWRWCFYINLPLGGFTIAALILFLHLDEKKSTLTFKEKLRKLDPFGTSLFLPSVTCLLLALQWGGSKYAWSSWRVVLLLVVFAVLFFIFVFVQYLTRNTTATIPTRIFLQRSVFCGGMFQLLVGSTMLTVILYLPLWFQAIKGSSAVKSGIQTLPMVLGLVSGSIICGGIVQRIGYYTPFMYFGPVLMSIGTGLLTTWTTSTNHSMWIGYQVILGIGIGSCMQQSNLAVQTVLKPIDVPTGSAIMFFFQTLGGAVFVAVGQNVFFNKFLADLEKIPGINAGAIVQLGATALKDAVPKEVLPQVLEAYNNSITKGPFFVALIVACLCIIPALGMEWRSTREGLPPRGAAAAKKQLKDEETGSLEPKVSGAEDKHHKDADAASVEVDSPVAEKKIEAS
jgi:EmrB/QacA subfamily drug resistance transporter